MLIVTDKNMWLRKGDTGQVEIGGLPCQVGLGVCLALFNEDTGKIVKEIECYQYDSGAGIALFLFPPSFSDDIPAREYSYAIKTYLNGWEDTIVPELVIQDGYVIEQPAPTFIIAEKRAEGPANTYTPTPTYTPEPTPEPPATTPIYGWSATVEGESSTVYTLDDEPAIGDTAYTLDGTTCTYFAELLSVEEDYSAITIDETSYNRDSGADTSATDFDEEEEP